MFTITEKRGVAPKTVVFKAIAAAGAKVFGQLKPGGIPYDSMRKVQLE
ncbi:hypothetical protein [Paenibacillus sp. B01]|nr:hypothetical protein [Paenibacillus sp. B01]QGG58491.1 hypothetical protein GE073_24845 [Paenibacillus sp. B01]